MRACVRSLPTLQMSRGMSRSTRRPSWSPPWRRKLSGMKEVSRETCRLACWTSIWRSSISMACKKMGWGGRREGEGGHQEDPGTFQPPIPAGDFGSGPAGMSPGWHLCVRFCLCKFDLEVEHLGRGLLLPLHRGLLLAHQLPVDILQAEAAKVRPSQLTKGRWGGGRPGQGRLVQRGFS